MEIKHRIGYRPDIDGLRALAVVSVILFHAGLFGVSGGFVGVDIFFVISGFLITSIIIADIDQQRFSLFSFYERRIRRIFPALFAVLLVTIVVAKILLLPKEYEAFGHSVIATDFFVSNLWFWHEAGYFDAPAAVKPLLHTWSLAVEEQFYFFFPLFLTLVAKYAKRRFVLYTVFTLIVSLALSAWGAYYKPTSTFYLVPTRAWELMLGSVLAMAAIKPIHPRWTREILAVTGLCLIGWSTFRFSDSTPFPGLNALYPCIGTALLIYTGADGKTAVSRLLGTRILVFIGLISYSLYLWHWPTIVFARYYEIEALSVQQVLALLLAVCVVSTLSWKYIERPFRKKNSIVSGKVLFVVSGASMIVLGITGSVIAVSHGWPERFSHGVQTVAAGAYDTNPDSERCRDKLPVDIQSGNICSVGAKDKAPRTFLLWGDSHADSIEPSVDSVARSQGLSGWFVARGGCPPVLGMGPKDQLNPCAELSSATMAFIASHNVTDVILAAWWPMYTGNQFSFIDATGRRSLEEPDRAVFERAFDRTLTRLREVGVSVYLIAPVPGARMNVPSALARSIQFSKDIDISVTEAEYLASNRWLLELFSSRRAEISKIIYPHKLLCGEHEKCLIANKQVPLYFDSSHLTVLGARFLDPLINRLFNSMKGSGKLMAMTSSPK